MHVGASELAMGDCTAVQFYILELGTVHRSFRIWPLETERPYSCAYEGWGFAYGDWGMHVGASELAMGDCTAVQFYILGLENVHRNFSIWPREIARPYSCACGDWGMYTGASEFRHGRLHGRTAVHVGTGTCIRGLEGLATGDCTAKEFCIWGLGNVYRSVKIGHGRLHGQTIRKGKPVINTRCEIAAVSKRG